jgi:hypothetical protein
MIRTFALAALIAAPSLAFAQTPAADSSDAPEDARQGFELVPLRPPPSHVAFVAPTSRSLLERPGRPDLPRTFEGLQYEASLRRDAREADLMEGPLNGQWRLVDAAGRQVYDFHLASSLSKGEPPSGAWRNPNVAKSATSAGFIALLGYDGAKLDMRFTERSPRDLVTVSLARDPAGRFAGQLTRNGVTTPVRLEKQP